MSNVARRQGVINALLLSNLVSIFLFGLRVIATHNSAYWFLFWNLLLAWAPVLWVWLLVNQLRHKSWKQPLPIFLTVLWLGFLPNSFYLMSDLIHLHSTGDIGLLFDVVLFLSCIWNGLVAGVLSLIWVHQAIIKTKGTNLAAWLMAAALLVTSFAIYLGRILRWNTWDLLINPAGVLFDVSERVINPLAHPQFVVTTLTFFVLLGSIYLVVWEFWTLAATMPPRKLTNKKRMLK
jgi:uncharacterized membrane protein